MGGIRFDEQVAAALEALPDELRAAMSNVELVVEDENPDDPDVYGLYTGIPLTERDSGYAGVLPDKIEIYRIPLEEEFGHDPALLVEEIRITVIHELAHHFGIDDDRLEDLGWAKQARRRRARSASAPKAPGREAQPAPAGVSLRVRRAARPEAGAKPSRRIRRGTARGGSRLPQQPYPPGRERPYGLTRVKLWANCTSLVRGVPRLMSPIWMPCSRQ